MRSAPLGRHRDTDVRQYSTSVHLTPRENSSLNYKLLSLSKYYLATGWLTLCGLGVAWELPGAQSVSVHMNPKFFCWKSLMLLIMMNSIKCDTVTDWPEILGSDRRGSVTCTHWMRGGRGQRAESSCATPVTQCGNGRDTWHVAAWLLTRAELGRCVSTRHEQLLQPYYL